MKPTGRHRATKLGGGHKSGQAIVEFAFASMIFLTIVFGTIDFGRAIFMTADLHNATREGARYAKINPTNTGSIKTTVVDKAKGTGLTTAGVTVACGSPGCASGETITVKASVTFQAVTQQLLGIGPITLKSSSTVDIE